MRELTQHEMDMLQTFAAKYGREWKSYLLAAWAGESYRGKNMAGLDAGTLRRIRNAFGPSWLVGFKLPKVTP
jgi:hypothetical protein